MSKSLFDIYEGHPFDGGHCFLCGTALNQVNRTVEHVFPKWLQAAFGIRDATITLLNGTTLPYRNLVIPCCLECNGTHLSQLEARVRSVIMDDTRELDEISDVDLNSWISKIYLGIHWKELELRLDRRDPNGETILSPPAMQNFRMVHLFLQACRKNMAFGSGFSGFPNSLLRIETKSPTKRENQFDYMDNFSAHTAGIRLGKKSILAIFDGGLHNQCFPDFSNMAFDGQTLHPVQFREVFAKVTYKSSLSRRIPFYGFLYDSSIDHHTVALLAFDDERKGASMVAFGGDDGSIGMTAFVPPEVEIEPSYGDWNQEEFAHILSMYSGRPVERLFQPPDMVVSWLRHPDGSFNHIPI